jgi:hypothetical protein
MVRVRVRVFISLLLKGTCSKAFVSLFKGLSTAFSLSCLASLEPEA